MAYDKKHYYNTALYDFAGATGEVGRLAVGTKIQVVKVGLCVNEEAIAGTAGSIEFNKVVDGTEAGSGDGGIITTGTNALGAVLVDTTSTIFPYELDAHDALIIDCATAPGTDGQGTCFVEYYISEDTAANNSNVTESA